MLCPQQLCHSFKDCALSLSYLMCMCVLSHFSCFKFFVTPWTVTLQAPLFMGFSQQEYWSGLPFPPPGGPPDPGIEPLSPALAGGFFTVEPPGKPHRNACCCSVAKSCPTLWDPMDCSMPGFPLEEGMANHSSILAIRTP